MNQVSLKNLVNLTIKFCYFMEAIKIELNITIHSAKRQNNSFILISFKYIYIFFVC